MNLVCKIKFASIILTLMLCSGCSEITEMVTGNKTITVQFQGKIPVAMPLKKPLAVTLSDIRVGQVEKADIDEHNKPVLTISFETKFKAALRRGTIFYLEKNTNTKELALVCLVDPDDKSKMPENLIFLGFPSYSDYLAWQAKTLLKKGVNDLIDSIDKAIN